MTDRYKPQRLTEQQKLWAKLYVKHNFNASKAAREAGYAESSAQSRGYENSHNTLILIEVARLVEERNKRLQIDADYVLQRLIEVDQLDVLDIIEDDGEVKPLSEWPKSWRTLISGIDVSEIFEGYGRDRSMTGLLKKIKWPDKTKNLEMLGKHIDVRAWEKEAGLTVSANNIMLVPSATSVDDWEKQAQAQQKEALDNEP